MSDYKDYWKDVEEAADYMSAYVEAGIYHPSTVEELNDRLHELIDSHHRVIYTQKAQLCLAYSPNCGQMGIDADVSSAIIDGVVNWSGMAYYAFRQDVMEHSKAPDWCEPFVCAECDEAFDIRSDAKECCEE